MPRFNPSTGEALCGVAGTRPSVDGTFKGPASGSTSPTVWYDNDNILHQVSGVLSKTNIRTNTTTTLGGAANELSGGKGKYLAWNSVDGLKGAITLTAGGLNRVITDARGANSNDGCLVYIPVRSASPGITFVRHPSNGSEVQLPDMFGLHLLKWGQAVWNGVSAGTLEFWGTSCAYIPGAQYAKMARIGSDLYILYSLSGIGLIAHKAILPTVYHTITAGNAFHQDTISYAGKLAVCYSLTTGEGPADLVKVMDVIGTKPTTAMPVNTIPGGAIVGPTIPPEIVITDEKLGVFPQFADLKGILAQSGNTDNALYQVVQHIIERLDQFKGTTKSGIEGVSKNSGSGLKSLIQTLSKPTYHTKELETLILPNSVQLLAGTGITFDDTVPHKRTISSTGGSGGGSDHYDAPLSDGNLTEADLIFASGECIIVQVPTP